VRREHPGQFSDATPRPAIAPVGEQGWLTPVRATAGSASDWIFDCRCGTRVVRRAKDVRKSVSLGRTPKCRRDCLGAPAAALENHR
jgi:hypothetical protein